MATTTRDQPDADSTQIAAATDSGQPVPDDRAAHSILLELVREIRIQRASFVEAQKATLDERLEAARERKTEHRWRMVFQTMVFVLPVLMGIYFFFSSLSSTGTSPGLFADKVALIRIEGKIGPNESASADRIIPLLERAFSSDNVKAVALAIDSPGGAPVETERIYTHLAHLKRQHPKPVVAFITNMGASAAYLLAIHADKIVAARYSIVGSIGAIMDTWQFDQALKRVDVSQRVFASGRLKSFLNPYTPPNEENDAKALALVKHVGTLFQEEVRARRGNRLLGDVDIATGEVWSGDEALRLGLVDEVGTVDAYVEATWSLPIHEFGPAQRKSSFLSTVIRDGLMSVLREVASPALQLR